MKDADPCAFTGYQRCRGPRRVEIPYDQWSGLNDGHLLRSSDYTCLKGPHGSPGSSVLSIHGVDRPEEPG